MDLKPEVTRLARLFLAGDSRAYEELVRLMHAPLARYALKFTSEQEEALDIAQETLVRLYHHAERIDSPETVLAWVWKTAKNLSIDWQRRQTNRRKLLSRLQKTEKTSYEIEPTDHLNVQEIRGLMELLPEAGRDILYLAMEPDLSVTDIAEILGIPEGTVKSRLFHARKKLKDILRKHGYANEENGS